MRVLELDTEIVFRSLADEAFRVHGARQVGVQIGALGHIVQEGIKGKRPLLAGLLEGLRGAGLAILRYGLRLRDGVAGARQSSVEAATWRARQMGARCRDIGREGYRCIRIVNCDPDFVYGSIHWLRVRLSLRMPHEVRQRHKLHSNSG